MRKCLAVAIGSLTTLTFLSCNHAPRASDQTSADFSHYFTISRQALQANLAVRARLLSGLTPAHRALVGRIVSALAVANDPANDHAPGAGAIRQLDAALTPAENASIMRTDAWYKAQTAPYHEWQRSQWAIQHPGQFMGESRNVGADPGATLLVLVTSSLATRTALDASALHRTRLKSEVTK